MEELIAKLVQEREPTPERHVSPPRSERLSRASTPEYEYIPPKGLSNDVRTGVAHSDLRFVKPRTTYYPSVSAAELEHSAEQLLRSKGRAKLPADYNDPFVHYTVTRLNELHQQYGGTQTRKPEVPEVVRIDVKSLVTVFKDVARVQDLIERGEFPVDTVLDAQEGNSALHLACENGALAMAEMLLQHGADPNLRTRVSGHTPAVLAASRGHVLCLAALWLAGADLDAGDLLEGKTPLHWAVWFGQIETVHYLVQDCNVSQTQRDCVSCM